MLSGSGFALGTSTHFIKTSEFSPSGKQDWRGLTVIHGSISKPRSSENPPNELRAEQTLVPYILQTLGKTRLRDAINARNFGKFLPIQCLL
jgi:hypothetical protein